MTNELIDRFKYLPNELINIIINYTDIVVYRNGKYINRIMKDDKRYLIIRKIPRPIKIGTNRMLFKLLNYVDQLGYLIEYKVENYIIVDVKFVLREIDGFDRYFNIKTYDTYLFDKNNKWSKIVSYIM